MTQKYAIIITSINHPTLAVTEIARNAEKLNADFIVVGDSKSPADFQQDGCLYYDVAQQQATGFAFAKACPTRHYARKNIGYLIAMQRGANVIVETDDDNIPRDDFWQPRSREVEARLIDDGRWINIYGYFSDSQIWPRGLPLDRILDPLPPLTAAVETLSAPIQQGLADDNPDVDAIYRLILPLPIVFKKEQAIALRNVWSPFNSQNTTWFSEAFPLLYLPFHCSFRMTDIWRSFVAQRIAYLNGWNVLYHASTVYQERNEHNLMRDFEEEVPGYLNNEKIKLALDSLDLKAGLAEIPGALRACYEKLIEIGVVGTEELPLLDAWLSDIAALQDVLL